MYYSKIKHYDIANGEGIRISLFVSGCKFHCKDCFNSETWEFNYGQLFTDEVYQDILAQATSSRYDGLSLLGGDPLWQTSEDMVILEKLAIDVKVHCKNVGDSHKIHCKNVWIWSGFTWENVMDETKTDPEATARRNLIKACDVWVDGRFESDKKDLRLKWRGSNNQRVIDVQKSLEKGEIVLWES